MTSTSDLNTQNTSEKSNADLSQPSLQAYRFLLVEDDPMIQMIHTRKLEKFGCSVDLAKNGAEALALHQNHRYDMAFVDIGLPDITGNEVMAQIRSTEDATTHLYMVALTAYSDAENQKKIHAAGADDILSKPLEDAKLTQVLGAVFS